MTYPLKVARDKVEQAVQAMSPYLAHCPAAQSSAACIDIQDRLAIEEGGRQRAAAEGTAKM